MVSNLNPPFGSPPHSLTASEKAVSLVVSQAVSAYKSELAKNNKLGWPWLTQDIKRRVGQIGINQGYSVSSSLSDKTHDAEWLYDLVWYKNNDQGLLKEVGLVLESELSDRSEWGIRTDFEKLLLAAAPLRIFIGMNAGNMKFPANLYQLQHQLNNYVQAYTGLSSGERVLTILWDDFYSGELHVLPITKN